MSKIHHQDVVHSIGEDRDAVSSRRSVAKRLLALGLVAGGLAPAVAEAKDGRGGKRGRRKGGGPRGRRAGGGVEAQAIADIPDPRISLAPNQSKYLIIGRKRLDDTYRVEVPARISFPAELLTLLRNGRYFGLTCQLWSWKRESNGTFRYRWVADMRNPNDFTWGGSSAPQSAGFAFVEDRVAAKYLDVNRQDPDYLHARLYLWTRAPGAAAFTRYKRQDGRDYFKLDTVQGNY